MEAMRGICALAAAGVLLSSSAAATEPTAAAEPPPKSESATERSVGTAAAGTARRLEALKGSFTVNGAVDSVTVTEDAVWAIVAVPQRLLPTHSLIRSDIASGHAADVGRIGGFAGGALLLAEGAVWAAEGLGGEKVHRVDPATGRIVASIAVARNPTGLAHGAGAIWVVASEESNKAGSLLLNVTGLALYRIDPGMNQVVASIPIPMADRPANTTIPAMVAFAGGAVWAGDSLTGSVLRVDPADNRIAATIDPPRAESTDVRRNHALRAVGDRVLLQRFGFRLPRGAGVATVTDITVWEIDAATNRFADRPAEVMRDGVVLAYVDGAAWLGSTRTDGLVRVDPATLQPLGPPVSVGHPVYALAGGRDSLLAIAGARRTAGDERDISWITRVVMPAD